MAPEKLPQVLESVLKSDRAPETVFADLLPAVCEVLQTDRCFLVVRNPHSRLYRVFCWHRPEVPDVSTQGWQKEEPWEQEDPLFAAALRADPSIFVEDVETASPAVLNREFEKKNFGHRALVHAHICQDGVLWGILQPCVFGQPKKWSDSDSSVVEQVIERIRPLVVSYGKTAA